MPIVITPTAGKFSCKLNLDDVEIGDINALGFKPHIKMKRFANQCDMAFSYSVAGSGGLASFDAYNQILKYSVDSFTDVEIHGVDPDQSRPEGAMEFNVILKKKPAGNKNTITLKLDTTTIDFEKIQPLNVEYDQAKCIDTYPKHQAPFVITPTSITDAAGEVLKTRAENLVNSYEGKAKQNYKVPHELGINKNNGLSMTYVNVSRTHAHIRRGKAKDAIGTEAWVEDMTLDAGGNLTFTLPLDFIKNAVYPIRQAVGVDPAYTQDMDSFQSDGYGGSDAVWGNYDLFTNKGVPKGAVAEFILSNGTTGTENALGLRTDGSSLVRFTYLHEAEGGGQTHCRMFVVCHATTGLIEPYHSDVSDADYFYLVGYWENVTFTELYTSCLADSSGAWDTKDLAAGYANLVLEIIICNNEADIANTMGVRKVGSALERKLLVHEPETGGYNLLDLLVKADANGDIALYSSDASNAYFLLAGYFGSEMDFVELFQQITLTTTSWEAEDLTAYLDQDGRMVDFLLAHEAAATAGVSLGVRSGDDAATERKLVEHEAEWTTADTHEYTGFSMSAQTNASGIVNLIASNAEEMLMLTGYFKPTAAGINYDRSAAVLVGELVSASRTRGYTRSPLVLVGNKVSQTRALATSRSNSVLLGNKVTATRASAGIRSASVLLGELVSFTRIRGMPRSASVIIGNLVSQTRSLTTSRSNAVLIGNKISQTRAITITRSASTLIGNKVSFTRFWNSPRVVSVLIGVKTTTTRALTSIRSVSILIGTLVSASRQWSSLRIANVLIGALVSQTRALVVTRSAPVLIGAKVTFAKIWNIPKSVSVIIGTLVSQSRLFAGIRSAPTLVGILVNQTRTYTSIRAALVLIGILTATSKIWNTNRIVSVLIGVKTTFIRAIATTRSNAVLIGNLVSFTKIWNSPRIVDVLIGVKTTASRAIVTTRISTVLIGNKVTAARSLASNIAQAVIIGTKVSAIRVVDITRNVATLIGELVSATAEWWQAGGGPIDYPRSAAVAIGVVVTSTRNIALSISQSVLIGIQTTVARIMGINRIATVLFGEKVLSERVATFARSSPILIGVKLLTDRIYISTRTASIIVGELVSITKSWNRTITASVVIGVIVTISRVYSAIRTALILIGAKVSSAMLTSINFRYGLTRPSGGVTKGGTGERYGESAPSESANLKRIGGRYG